MVYQDLSLALDLSVADNLFLGREPLGGGWRRRLDLLDRDQMRRDARTALAAIGIRLQVAATWPCGRCPVASARRSPSPDP